MNRIITEDSPIAIQEMEMKVLPMLKHVLYQEAREATFYVPKTLMLWV